MVSLRYPLRMAVHEFEATSVQLDAIKAKRMHHFVVHLSAISIEPFDILHLRERSNVGGFTEKRIYAMVLFVEHHQPGLVVMSIQERASTGRFNAIADDESGS